VGHVVRMDNELPKKKLWTNTGGRDMVDWNQDGLAGQRKMQGNWVVQIGWWIPRIEVAGNICLRPRPTQGHTDDDDDDDKNIHKNMQEFV